MKKNLTAAIAAMLAVSLTGCSLPKRENSRDNSSTSSTSKISTTSTRSSETSEDSLSRSENSAEVSTSESRPEESLPEESGIPEDNRPGESLPEESGIPEDNRPGESLPEESGVPEDNRPGESLPEESVTPEESSSESGGILDSIIDEFSFESIYNDYAEQIEDAAADCISEINANKANIEALADISADGIDKMAELCAEGVDKMAEKVLLNGAGYVEWSSKLTTLYNEKSTEVTNAYMNASVEGAFGGLDFDLNL